MDIKYMDDDKQVLMFPKKFRHPVVDVNHEQVSKSISPDAILAYVGELLDFVELDLHYELEGPETDAMRAELEAVLTKYIKPTFNYDDPDFGNDDDNSPTPLIA